MRPIQSAGTAGAHSAAKVIKLHLILPRRELMMNSAMAHCGQRGGWTLTGRNERKCRRFLKEGSKTRGGGERLGVEVWTEKKGRESERRRPSLCDVDLFSLELAVSHADEPCSF